LELGLPFGTEFRLGNGGGSKGLDD
jgi:hypothetical protein